MYHRNSGVTYKVDQFRDGGEIVPLFCSPGQLVKLFIALAVLFTYGLQLFVPLDIILRVVKERCSYKYQNIAETLVRVGMALFTSKSPGNVI